MIFKNFMVWAIAALAIATAGVVEWGGNSDAASPAVSAPLAKSLSVTTGDSDESPTGDPLSPANSPFTKSTGPKPPASQAIAPKASNTPLLSPKSYAPKPLGPKTLGPKAIGSKTLVSRSEPESPADLEGFTEPYRTINLAFEDMGTIEEVLVREGDAVKVGQTIARLNSTVHLALLAIAEQNMKSEGRLDAALADLKLRKERLQKLEPLRAQGHARQEEVDRAALELAVAEANLRTAREELIAKRLEHEKIKAQIACRSVRASVDGVVTKVHKQMGEFVAPNSPDVVTIVQLDKLYATFTVSTTQASRLVPGEIFSVDFETGDEVSAVVEFVSPVTNAESGTVLVKLRIDNVGGRTRSGDRCRLRLAE